MSDCSVDHWWPHQMLQQHRPDWFLSTILTFPLAAAFDPVWVVFTYTSTSHKPQPESSAMKMSRCVRVCGEWPNQSYSSSFKFVWATCLVMMFVTCLPRISYEFFLFDRPPTNHHQYAHYSHQIFQTELFLFWKLMCNQCDSFICWVSHCFRQNSDTTPGENPKAQVSIKVSILIDTNKEILFSEWNL